MINSLLNKTVAVLGLGKSGMAVVRELKQRGVHVVCWDDHLNLRIEAEGFGAKVQDLQTLDFNLIEMLVISPGIAHTYPEAHPVAKLAREHNVKIVCDIELFVSTYNKSKYIGITGTNGKSTTTALVHHILTENGIKAEIGGNFGIPVFDLLDIGSEGYYVFELSSYQLELCPSLDLDIAVLLNITPDHLSRHNGMDGYIAAKELVFKRKSKKNISNIIAIDDGYTKDIFRDLVKNSSSSVHNIAVSMDHKIDGYYVNSKGTLIDNTGDERKEIFDLSTLGNIVGKHNWQNILCAFAVAKRLGIATSKIISAITTFKTLDHRIETIGEVMGITFINDSKATNAESVKYAIASIKDVYWIIGGRKKEGGITILEPEIKSGNIKSIFTIGECEKEFYNFTKKIVPSYKCGRLDKAMNAAFKLALKDIKKGKVNKPVILLSPACASFDQYKSFEDRGHHFQQVANTIIDKYKAKPT